MNTINRWVSDNTDGKIKNILSRGSVTPDTKLIVTGAMYFEALWHNNFTIRITKDESFHLINGDIVSAPMMNKKFATYYCESEDYQALELLYNMFDYSMIIILPKKGSFNKIENSMTPEFLKSVITSRSPKVINVKFPKFSNSYQPENLEKTLISIGLKDVFTQSADFTGIYKSEKTNVSNIVHKAFISVNENGTIAEEPKEFEPRWRSPIDMPITNFFCDRPFIYLIYNKKINTILFIGRMMNPKE